MKQLDFDKLQKEFEKALADYDPKEEIRGLTCAEWGNVWGVSTHTANDYLRQYVVEGIMEFVGRAPRRGIDNIYRRAPVYAPVSTGPASTSKKNNVSDP